MIRQWTVIETYPVTRHAPHMEQHRTTNPWRRLTLHDTHSLDVAPSHSTGVIAFASEADGTSKFCSAAMDAPLVCDSTSITDAAKFSVECIENCEAAWKALYNGTSNAPDGLSFGQSESSHFSLSLS